MKTEQHIYWTLSVEEKNNNEKNACASPHKKKNNTIHTDDWYIILKYPICKNYSCAFTYKKNTPFINFKI